MTHPLRVAENCTTYPLRKAQNLKTHPRSAPAHLIPTSPPPYTVWPVPEVNVCYLYQVGDGSLRAVADEPQTLFGLW